MTYRKSPKPTLWVGPIVFAGVMICVVGLFNALTGLSAVFADEVYVSAPGTLVVWDVTSWGWIHVVVGAMLLVSGLALLLGQAWARAAAVGLVVLNMLTQLMLLPAYPFWALATIALDVLVVWALLVHGDEIPSSLG